MTTTIAAVHLPGQLLSKVLLSLQTVQDDSLKLSSLQLECARLKSLLSVHKMTAPLCLYTTMDTAVLCETLHPWSPSSYRIV